MAISIQGFEAGTVLRRFKAAQIHLVFLVNIFLDISIFALALGSLITFLILNPAMLKHTLLKHTLFKRLQMPCQNESRSLRKIRLKISFCSTVEYCKQSIFFS